MGTVVKITAGGATHLIASTAYGTCTTAAATAAKIATIQDSQAFSLVTGVTVFIKMSETNSVASPTLNVNSTGAKSIMRYGTTAPSTSANTSWNAGSVVSFTYDGTYWQMNDFALKGNDNTVPSAYCTTGAGTAAKTASCSDYALLANSYLMLIVKNANTSASALTLNVNGKGAKTIYINGTASSSSNYTLPAGSYITYYDGTYYHLRTDGKIPNLATVASTGSYSDLSNKPTIPAAVAVKGNSESTYRTGNVNLTAANIGAAASSHTHGNIQNGGTLQTSDITIASGDKLVVTDSSDSNKIARTSLSFDGSTTTQFLSKAGTFVTPTVSVTIDENTEFNISGTTFKIELVS